MAVGRSLNICFPHCHCGSQERELGVSALGCWEAHLDATIVAIVF